MRSQKGQSLVETALVIPILLLILFGIVDFGRIFHAYLTLDHAGREAARVATVGEDDGVIGAKILSATSTLTNRVTYSISPGTRKSGDEATITITYPVDFLTPIIGQIIGTFNIENKTVMRVE